MIVHVVSYTASAGCSWICGGWWQGIALPKICDYGTCRLMSFQTSPSSTLRSIMTRSCS